MPGLPQRVVLRQGMPEAPAGCARVDTLRTGNMVEIDEPRISDLGQTVQLLRIGGPFWWAKERAGVDAHGETCCRTVQGAESAQRVVPRSRLRTTSDMQWAVEQMAGAFDK